MEYNVCINLTVSLNTQLNESQLQKVISDILQEEKGIMDKYTYITNMEVIVTEVG